jgi:hypothetical protein
MHPRPNLQALIPAQSSTAVAPTGGVSMVCSTVYPFEKVGLKPPAPHAVKSSIIALSTLSSSFVSCGKQAE